MEIFRGTWQGWGGGGLENDQKERNLEFSQDPWERNLCGCLEPTSRKEKTNTSEQGWKTTAGFKTKKNFYTILGKSALHLQGTRPLCETVCSRSPGMRGVTAGSPPPHPSLGVLRGWPQTNANIVRPWDKP